jgi:hypothetical protein
VSGYACARSGAFGVVVRVYVTGSGVPMAVLRWGPLGWITPIAAADLYACRSQYESEARAEAEAWHAAGCP